MRKEISKKLEGAAWEKEIEKAYEKASKNFKVDGFRPGHAPKDIFMKKYKEETLWMDDGTPMTPALTRYLYHQMYGLSDIYENDEEDGDDE